MASGIPLLTDKGRKAVKDLQSGLTARCRSILVQVDGKRSIDEIWNSLRGLDGLDDALMKLTSEGYVHLSQSCKDLVKEAAQKMLGVKAATIVRKIDELHQMYGDACWEHLDELDKSARLFYGEVVAQNLRNEITALLNASRK